MVDGNIVGHFVDREMFRSTGYQIENYPDTATFGGEVIPLASRIVSPCGNDQYLILKRFDFDPHIQRASVLFATPNKGFGYSLHVSVKGSPEAIFQICKQETLPIDYIESFQRYSSQGYYVIALAMKNIDDIHVTDLTPKSITNMTRMSFEQDLTFCGFILFQSPIKPESYSVIRQLVSANIRNTIITGDSALTAIHVSRELKLVNRVLLIERQQKDSGVTFSEIPTSNQAWSISLLHRSIEELPLVMSHCPEGEFQLAITCAALNYIFDNYEDSFCNWIMENTIIFARAKPQDKTMILEKYILMGHYTAMTGDGTNDCGALKAAHVGMALSDTEASIVAPFSSASKSVSDIPKLLAEGRCALETSFTAFKYMAVYPVVQLVASIIAYYYSSQMGNAQYLVDDLGLVFGLATFMLYTGPAKKLAKEVPVKSLFSRIIIYSLVGQIVINVTFSVGAFLYTKSQPWFCSSLDVLAQYDNFELRDPSNENHILNQCYKIDKYRDVTEDTLIATYESTFPWVFGHFQYIGTAMAFCLSTTFRKPFWSNKYFMGWLILVYYYHY
jgi:magnesium-transporting ATPase (P-type)